MIPLSQLADIIVEDGPAQISRENIHRKISVEANVRGRDLGSFVADVQQAVAARVTAARRLLRRVRRPVREPAAGIASIGRSWCLSRSS